MTRPTALTPRRPARCRNGGDGGAASVAVVVWLFPVTVVMLLAGIQTVSWNHARNMVMSTAQATAASVARGAVPEAEAISVAKADLARVDGLRLADVSITTTDGRAVVAVRGYAPGIITGTQRLIEVRATEPIEGWQP